MKELKEDSLSEFEKALKIVIKEIKKDKDLYYGYQANIAVQFQDEYARFFPEKSRQIGSSISHIIHEISNNAARNFLNLLIND
jgi:hypothetical protein